MPKLIKGPTRPKFDLLLKCFMLILSGKCWVYAASILEVVTHRYILNTCTDIMYILEYPRGTWLMKVESQIYFSVRFLILESKYNV